MEQDVLRGVLRLPYENADFAQVVWLTRAELVPPPTTTSSGSHNWHTGQSPSFLILNPTSPGISL